MTSQPIAEAQYRRHNTLSRSQAHSVESILVCPRAALPGDSLAHVVARTAAASRPA